MHLRVVGPVAMPSENDKAVWPEHLRATASVCRQALEPFVDARWDSPAGELEWSCRTTLVHVLSALLYYSIQPCLALIRASVLGPSGSVLARP